MEIGKMKRPEEPRSPYAPVEPQEFYEKRNPIDLRHESDMTLATFLEKLPKGVSSSDIRFGHTSCYHCEYDLDEYVEIYYITQEKTHNYKSQMINYRKQLKQYTEQVEEYKTVYADYLEQKKLYDAWAEEQELKRCQKRVQELQKKRAKS